MSAFGMSGEFWAAIVGAVVGGLISACLQLISARSTAKEKRQTESLNQQSLVRTLLFKIVKIESDFIKFRQHADQCKELAEADGLPLGWATFNPFASFPRPVEFTAEEMGALIAVGDEELFNDIIALDEVHSGTLETLQLYRRERMALSDRMPAQMQGTKGTSTLTEDEYRTLAPKMAQLDQLAIDIIAFLQAETTESFVLSRRLAAAINKRFGLKLRIEEEPTKASNAPQ